MASTPAGFDRIRRPGDPTTKMHPMLSATQFAQTSNATGGATMDLHTGRVFAAGTREKPGRYDLWSTGGAPDTEGTKIPSEIVPHVNGQRAMTPYDVELARARITAQTPVGALGRGLGAWDASDFGRHQFEIDAVDLHGTRADSALAGYARREDAIFGLKHSAIVNLRYPGRGRRP